MIQLLVETILKTQSSYRQIIQRKFREEGLDLNIGMLSILKSLSIRGNLNQQELTVLVFRDKSNLSYLVKGMEKKGLVGRVEDPKDKRSKLVSLTSEGEKVYKEGMLIVNQVFDEIAQEVDLSHVEKCIEYLTEFTDRITQN